MTTMRRQVTEKIITGLCLLATLAVVGVLFLIIGQIFINGLPSLSWYFITTPENATPGLGQGIANAIAGTILISFCAVVVAAPFGFGTAVYMKRYAPDNKITRAFRFLLEVLSGTPSIVVGVFGFLIFVIYLKKITGGYSLIAGSLALAILIMPVIERAIEDAIDRVSRELEEGSYALGADKWQTIRGITIPTAFTGILTGLTLGFGRAAEESAVVILTAGYTQYMPDFAIRSGSDAVGTVKVYPLQDQVATLPYTVYHAFQNQTLVKPSAGFAAAFVLVAVVLTINIAGKTLLERTMGSGKADTSLIGMIRDKLSSGKKIHEQVADNQKELHYEMNPTMPEPADQPKLSFTDRIRNLPPVKKIVPLIMRSGKEEAPLTIPSPENDRKKQTTRVAVPAFLRTLLPFAIPATLLLLIAFLATIPPLHHVLGMACPWLAGVFAILLSLIIVVAGIVFALLFAKKSGAFKKKTRRTGYAGVIAGFCLVCIAGIICASSASGVFSTDTGSSLSATSDRNAKLAALLAAGEPGSGGSEVQVQEPAAQTLITPAPAPGNNTTVSVPRKDALSVGESYSWGDAEHSSRATIYDYKVLPFYFWWWIDYNRFVQQMPAAGNAYLVVFIRIENTGTQSAVVPTADAFNVTYNGNSGSRLPYLNRSFFSPFQLNELGLGSSPSLQEQYYQWIREIGQDKRDYAYLTGENLFSTTYTASDYNGAFLKPGQSQAIDGYLIFEVPREATNHLNETFVDVSFNSLSNGRWKLG